MRTRSNTSSDRPSGRAPGDDPASSAVRRLGILAAVTGCSLLTIAASGCGKPDVSQYNYPPSITSVGPISLDDSSVMLDYTIRDREGDDQTIYVGVCAGESPPDDERCAKPVRGLNGDGTTYVPTVPRGEDVPHVFSWNIGCGRLKGGKCVDTKLDQTYHFRVRVEGQDETSTSKRFKLNDEFGLSSIPSCEASAGRIPEPCTADDGDSQ